jgi:hypothetical protein
MKKIFIQNLISKLAIKTFIRAQRYSWYIKFFSSVDLKRTFRVCVIKRKILHVQQKISPSWSIGHMCAGSIILSQALKLDPISRISILGCSALSVTFSCFRYLYKVGRDICR